MINNSKNPNFLNDFLNYELTVCGKSNQSISVINYDINVFIRFLVSLENDELEFNKIDISTFDISLFGSININDIYKFVYYLKEDRGVGAKAINRYRASLILFFDYLIKIKGFEISNPFYQLKRQKTQKGRIKAIDEENCKKLIQNVKENKNRNKERDLCIIVLFLNLGLRVSELCKINILDILFEENKIIIHGKGNRERILYLNESCNIAINDYLKVRNKNKKLKNSDSDSYNALFLSEVGERVKMRTVQYVVKNQLHELGLDSYSTHSLRHSFATALYQNGVDILDIKELLGHTRLNTTERYLSTKYQNLKDISNNNPINKI